MVDVIDELEDVQDSEDVPYLEDDDVDEQGNSNTDCLVRNCCVNKIRFGVACQSIGKCRNLNMTQQQMQTNKDRVKEDERNSIKCFISPHLGAPLCSCTLYATPILLRFSTALRSSS